MKHEDLFTPQTEELIFTLEASASKTCFETGDAELFPADGGAFLIKQGGTCHTGIPQRPEAHAGLYAIIARTPALYLLGHISRHIPGMQLHVQVTPVTRSLILSAPLYINYDESKYGEPDIRRWKNELALGPATGKRLRCILFQPRVPFVLDEEEDGQTPDQEGGGENGLLPEDGFYLIAPNRIIYVQAEHCDARDYYRIRQVKKRQARHFLLSDQGRKGRLVLLEAELDIVSARQARENYVRMEINSLCESSKSYLDIWRKYGEVERELLYSTATSICRQGRILRLIPEEGRVELRLEPVPAQANTPESQMASPEPGTGLLLYAERPGFYDLKGAAMLSAMENSEEFRHALECLVIKAEGDTIYLSASIPGEKLQGLAEGEGCFVATNIKMELTPMRRRKTADTAIRNGTCANPELALIIEPESSYRARAADMGSQIPAYSRFLRSKLKRELTPVQEEAVSIALNTPDIAVIQGPPGTGKTTVITAILERLNEIQDKTSDIRGAVLVTSFQHDAVENVIERLSINSLPTIKFGRKAGAEDQGEEANARKLEKWCGELARGLLGKYPELAHARPEQELPHLIQAYRKAPAQEKAERILTMLCNWNSSTIPPQLVTSRVLPLFHELQEKAGTRESGQGLRSKVLALRTKPASFSDDGADRAYSLLQALKAGSFPGVQAGEQEQLSAILQEAADWDGPPSDELLMKLKAVRLTLMRACVPAPEFTTEKTNARMLEVLEEIEPCLGQGDRTTHADKTQILADFYQDLIYNPDAMISTLESYNYVYAATNQQSLGKDILRCKGVGRRREGDSETEDSMDPASFYETVIVDEAAKSAPPDLLIPMALAKRRIVLVGDHRQLPHMIDELVEKGLTENAQLTQDERELIDMKLKVSMFERIKTRLEELERKDGIKRTITLDTQYRTHPVLGRLVSKHFYEQHGEGYESGLDAAAFRHELPVGNAPAGKPCYWLDVPSSDRKDYGRDSLRSLYRPCEADAIARLLKSWMDSTQGRDLTFGVISFYKAQCNELLNSMERLDMAADKKVAAKYRFLSDGKGERLRIGTVDSFQGMEFDVVILSMVRTSHGVDKQPHPFGFLDSPNRLCVALSRQKKVLVIAGDSALAASPKCRDSKRPIAIINEFLNICKRGREGGVLS